jgi:predicted secreted Zn-dependent protease
MPAREEVERLLADLRRRREESVAEAGHAAEKLARMVSGLTPLAEADTEQVRAAADTFSDAVARLKSQEQFARELRALLM